MPDKIPTYRIDENALRSKLLNYKVEINPAECNAIEQEVAALRFKKTISLPPVNLRIVVPAILIITLTTLALFNLDAIKGLFTSAPGTKIENKLSAPSEQPKAATPTVTVNPAPTPTVTNNIPPVDAAALAKKQDSVLSAAKKADSLKQLAKKPIPVIAPPPSDSAAKNNVIGKPDTSIQGTDQPVKKKKKRRRSKALEDIKRSTLEQNSADDDVVVPQ